MRRPKLPGLLGTTMLVSLHLPPPGATPLLGQQDTTPSPTVRGRTGAQFLIPLSSVPLPGLGQYLYGDPAAGAGLTGTAGLGSFLVVTGNTGSSLPRHWDGQRAHIGAQLYLTAGGLSAYDAFHRAVPALQVEGKYGFLTAHEPTAALLTAPFDPRFLGRWTTWLGLAYTGVVAAVLVDAETAPGKRYEPYRFRDAAFSMSLSWNAGVGEEALFRGWLYPLFHHTFGERFWLSNGVQAAAFGALHPQAGRFAAVIAGWAFYQGWLTRRNGWSVRESIFHHFWYDLVIVTAILLTDDRDATLTVVGPPIRF